MTAQDTFGNTTPAYGGTIHFASSDGQAVLPMNYPFVAGDSGVHTFSGIILKTAAVQSITATDTVMASITGSQTGIVVTPAPASLLVVTGFPTLVTAGTAATVTVTAKDVYGNIAGGYRGTAHFTSSDTRAMLPADYPFTATDNGVHTFSGIILKTAGSQSIRATDTVTMSITGMQAGIVVMPAAADHFGITAPPRHRAGRTFALTITALDPYGNVAVNYLGTVTFSSSDPQAVLPDDTTFTGDDQGMIVLKHGATLLTAGSQTITATDVDTGLLSGSATVTVSPAAADHFRIDAPAQHRAGQAFAVTVTALDPYGNVAVRYTGSVTFTSSDLGDGVVLPDDYTFTADDAGVHAFPGVVLVTAGDQTITVADIETGLLSGSATVTIRPGPTPFTHQGWNLEPHVFPAFGFPSWAVVPRLPEVPALVADSMGDPQADETRPVRGAEVDSLPIALVESQGASRPMVRSRSAAAVADEVWLNAFRGLWLPFESLLETRREDGEEA